MIGRTGSCLAACVPCSLWLECVDGSVQVLYLTVWLMGFALVCL